MGRPASGLLLLAMTGFSATYVKSLTLIFVSIVPAAPVWLLSAGLALTALAVVVGGGLNSVVRSDQVGFALTIMQLPVLLYVGWQTAGLHALTLAFPRDQLTVSPIAQWNHAALPFRFVFTLMVLTCFTYISAPWFGQKIFAAKDARTASAAVGIAAVLIFLLQGTMVLGAAFYRAMAAPLANPDAVVPAMIAAWLPAGARGTGIARLFTAAMTTLAGVWSAMTAKLSADFRVATTVRGQRIAMALLALLCWLGANVLVDDIPNRLILANIPVAALSFALLDDFQWRGATTAGAWASVVVGVAWGVGCIVVVGEAGGYTWLWAMYGVPLIFGTGIVVSPLTPPSTSAASSGSTQSAWTTES